MSPRVLMVDWLGRGGIAQATEAWAIELGDRHYDVEVVTRPGRELGQGLVPCIAAPGGQGRLGAHRGVAVAAAQRIREVRPDCVIVQNYIVPRLERPAYEAARAVGAHLVVVVHDDRPHTWRAGTTMGLTRNLRTADLVVAHSKHVATSVRRQCRRDDVAILPLPVPIGMLWHRRESRPAVFADDADARWCGHFGVVHRRYKGTEVVERLARDGVEGWEFAVFGSGAEPGPGLHALSGYLEPGELLAAVSATDVTIAPYSYATQSAVVVLAHVLGSVPIATAIGGIPEQVGDGVDGVLVRPRATVDEWRDALGLLRDDDYRKELAVAGEARAWADHTDFVAGLARLLP